MLRTDVLGVGVGGNFWVVRGIIVCSRPRSFLKQPDMLRDDREFCRR